MILKKKKQYQNQLNGYFNQLGTIDQLTLQTQSMKNHKQMVINVTKVDGGDEGCSNRTEKADVES